METQFAKIVTGPDGENCILIDEHVISLNVPRGRNDDFVLAIVRGLRNQCWSGTCETPACANPDSTD